MSKNYKEELVLLLDGKNTPLERKLKSMIITIARRSGLETPIMEKYGGDFVEDIYSWFFLHLMENKHLLISKEFISINYISVMIKNLMVDKLNGSRYIKTVSYEDLNYKDDEGREVSFESTIKDKREFFSQHEGDQLFNLILKSLDQKDLIALCYKNFHRITQEDLIIHIGQLEGQKWQEVCTEFINRIRRLDSELSDRLRLNLVINGPTALAMALGILYSHTRPFTVFHYSNSEKRYHPIHVFNTRELKERVKEYTYTDAQLESSDGEDLAVIIRGAHHDPVRDVKAYLKKEGISANILVLSPNEKEGNIPPNQLKEIAKEYASRIQSAKAQKYYKNVHFFLSSPVAIAFMLGAAFGHYTNGFIYNYRNALYEKVLSLEYLRGLIEKA